VRQDGFDLDRAQAAEQRIKENDALGLAETREVGVAVARAS